jgi:Ca-activated chloride channel family protein
MVIIIAFLSASTAKAANDPDTLYRQGKFAEAQKAYTETDMNHPKDIRFRYNRGCAAYQNSDYKAAAAAFSSVLTRTEDKEIRFKALYNLGNTAFKQGDFESAASYYKQAIICNPGNENEDAGYNLELSLLELEKQKKNNKDQKNETQKDSQNKEDKPGQSGENKNNENHKNSDKKSSDNKENKRKDTGDDKKKEQNQEKAGQGGSKDISQSLSGGLNPLQQPPEQKENMATDNTMSMLNKKKADALIDSIRENRSKFLKFQVSGNVKESVRSGKDW